MNRAQRDKIYIDAGVFTPTKEYIVEVLGIDEQYFELGENNRRVGNATHQQTAGLHNSPPLYTFSADLVGKNAHPTADEETNPQHLAFAYPFLVKIFDALSRADTPDDFQAALNAMDLSDEENAIVATHLPEIVKAYLDGLNND